MNYEKSYEQWKESLKDSIALEVKAARKSLRKEIEKETRSEEFSRPQLLHVFELRSKALETLASQVWSTFENALSVVELSDSLEDDLQGMVNSELPQRALEDEIQYYLQSKRPSYGLYSHREDLDQAQQLILCRLSSKINNAIQKLRLNSARSSPKRTGGYYVAPERIEELRRLNSPDFDLTKLLRLCDELNICFQGSCHFAVAALSRTILNHVPPLLGKSDTFERAVPLSSGTSSFKDHMVHFATSCRQVANDHLHSVIRKHEVLPNDVQVDFSNAIDVLLAEIIRSLKGSSSLP